MDLPRTPADGERSARERWERSHRIEMRSLAVACAALGVATVALLGLVDAVAWWTPGAAFTVAAVAVIRAALPGPDGPSWALPAKRAVHAASLAALAVVAVVALLSPPA